LVWKGIRAFLAGKNDHASIGGLELAVAALGKDLDEPGGFDLLDELANFSRY
jgi:hypothetical protein